jgi:hypothetical protein
MDRRGFLGTLIGLTATAVLDPERLLWVPGQKTIFLPPAIVSVPVDVVGTNAFITPQWITAEALRAFEQNIRMTGRVIEGLVPRIYDRDLRQIGSVVAVRVPQRYRVGSARA